MGLINFIINNVLYILAIRFKAL